MTDSGDTILSVRHLKTHFSLDAGEALAVDDISFDIHAGRTFALVGESGCGKSVTALSIMRLVPDPPGRIAGGEIRFRGRDLLSEPEKNMLSVRGNEVSMIFQEPMTSLNPVFRVGGQIASTLLLHRHQSFSKTQARSATIDLLESVGIPSPELRANDYPHQMSGGMRQRVMIAMALACEPKLLIADEPTTALDVTIQAQILDLLRTLQEERGMAILLITHDLGVVAEMAHDVAIMYAGKIAEEAPVSTLFKKRSHPYTAGLFDSIPTLEYQGKRLNTISGQVPAATDFPSGCRFHPRCARALERCASASPVLELLGEGHRVSCWLYGNGDASENGRAAAGSKGGPR